jgi:hypothetical protein
MIKEGYKHRFNFLCEMIHIINRTLDLNILVGECRKKLLEAKEKAQKEINRIIRMSGGVIL